MSDAGSVSALIDDKALRLDDQSPPDSHMASPAPEGASASAECASAPTATPPARSEQLARTSELLNQPLQVGQSWYIVSRSWYQRWAAACNSQDSTDSGEAERTQVGPIDSSELAAEGQSSAAPALKPRLQDGHDYELLPEEAWTLLVSWYGATGPVFKRSVISVEGAPPVLEMYVPLVGFSQVVTSVPEPTPAPTPVALSKITPLSEVRDLALNALRLTDVTASNARLLLAPPTVTPASQIAAADVKVGEVYQVITEEQMSGPLASIIDRPEDQVFPIAVEVKTGEGQWPSEQPSQSKFKNMFAQSSGDYFTNVQRSSAGASSPAAVVDSAETSSGRVTRSKTANERAAGRPRGLKGLNNLGNTCFMNSALQCLSNTVELKEYFVSGVFEDEINADNPLGNGGALARAFGSLIQQLWSGQGTAIPPRDFKWSLARFAPQFSGYAQQDTQELLAFLLDGLHEDLNRIKKKPYIEAPDWEGGGLADMVRFAKKQWEIYKLRNDSVIVDLFQGQYRSTLVCPQCSKVSIKFDPFMYLTLPLPNKTMWRHTVTFIPFDPTKGIKKINMTLPTESSMAKLKQALSEVTGVEVQRIGGAEIWSHKVYRFYYDYEPVHSIERNDHAFFWELPHEVTYPSPKAASNHNIYSTSPIAKSPATEEAAGRAPPASFEKDEHVILPVFTQPLHGRSSLGTPFFVCIDRADVNDAAKIRQAVLEQYRRYSSDYEGLVAAENQPTAPPNSSNEWELVDAQGATSERPASHDVVAEIRADGQVIETSDLESAKPSTSSLPPPVVELEGGSGARVSTAPFEIHYMVNTSTSKPMLKDADAWYNASEELNERVQRLEKVAEEENGTRVPLVYRGGALVCIWTPEAAQRYLLPCGGDETWGTSAETVDDAGTAAEKAAIGAGKRKGKKQLSIEDCLDEFTREEKLGEEDPWYCPQCKDFRQATKKFDLWKAPDILVVHLKRFSAGRGLRDKIDTVVDFPIEGLDLTDRVEGAKAVQQLKAEGLQGVPESIGVQPSASSSTEAVVDAGGDSNGEQEDLGASFLSAISEANDDAVASDKPIYDLFAVDNHYGGLGGGHYTSSARNAEDGKWYYFDDSSVRPISNPEEVKGSAAYLLFYRRRTSRNIGGKTREIVARSAAAREAAAANAAEGDDTLRNDDLPGSYNHAQPSSSSSSAYPPSSPDDPYRSYVPGAFPFGGGESMTRDVGRATVVSRSSSQSSLDAEYGDGTASRGYMHGPMMPPDMQATVSSTRDEDEGDAIPWEKPSGVDTPPPPYEGGIGSYDAATDPFGLENRHWRPEGATGGDSSPVKGGSIAKIAEDEDYDDAASEGYRSDEAAIDGLSDREDLDLDP